MSPSFQLKPEQVEEARRLTHAFLDGVRPQVTQSTITGYVRVLTVFIGWLSARTELPTEAAPQRRKAAATSAKSKGSRRAPRHASGHQVSEESAQRSLLTEERPPAEEGAASATHEEKPTRPRRPRKPRTETEHYVSTHESAEGGVARVVRVEREPEPLLPQEVERWQVLARQMAGLVESALARLEGISTHGMSIQSQARLGDAKVDLRAARELSKQLPEAKEEATPSNPATPESAEDKYECDGCLGEFPKAELVEVGEPPEAGHYCSGCRKELEEQDERTPEEPPPGKVVEWALWGNQSPNAWAAEGPPASRRWVVNAERGLGLTVWRAGQEDAELWLVDQLCLKGPFLLKGAALLPAKRCAPMDREWLKESGAGQEALAFISKHPEVSQALEQATSAPLKRATKERKSKAKEKAGEKEAPQKRKPAQEEESRCVALHPVKGTRCELEPGHEDPARGAEANDNHDDGLETWPAKHAEGDKPHAEDGGASQGEEVVSQLRFAFDQRHRHTPGPWSTPTTVVNTEGSKRSAVLVMCEAVKLATLTFEKGDDEAEAATKADAKLMAGARDFAAVLEAQTELLERVLRGDLPSAEEVKRLTQGARALLSQHLTPVAEGSRHG